MIHNTYRRPSNRIAAIRQSHTRHFSTGWTRGRLSAKTFRGPNIGFAVNRLFSRAPFASALRPNLTGGALCRTAGGYSIGAGRIGGARYFSSTPAHPAQVIQNVSAGVRAFWLSGQRARFDGVDPRTGAKNYKTVTALQQETGRKMRDVPRTAPGSHIDFSISPTITAFGYFNNSMQNQPEASINEHANINSTGLMELLSVDFARVLKDLTSVLNDLKKLATLGDLPLSLHDQSTIRVQFPGCDAESVERLCTEVGVQRGVIHQDEDFEIQNGTVTALLFPFAPSDEVSETELFSYDNNSLGLLPDIIDWRQMIHPEEATQGLSNSPREDNICENPWTRSPSGFSSISISELGDREFFADLPEYSKHIASDYGGLEGIYKFLQECDRARR